jgi:hypothetical protein
MKWSVNNGKRKKTVESMKQRIGCAAPVHGTWASTFGMHGSIMVMLDAMGCSP